MKKTVQNLSKKKSFLHYLWKLSGFFKGMMLLIGAVIVGVPDYLLSVKEAAVLIKKFSTLSHGNEKVLLCLLMILNLVVLAVAFLIFVVFIPEIRSSFCRIAAIRRYCYIPLTEAEVRKKDFASANEYFMFVNNLLSYWDPDYYNSKNYIILDNEDLYEMLNVCYKVFHDNGSIFTITKETVNCCDYDFQSFFLHYYDRKQEGKTSKETAHYDKDRNIILSYMCKKEIAKLKIRKPVTQKAK